MANGGGGDVFFLLPRVLLEGGVFVVGLGAESLRLLAIERLLEWVKAEGREELSRTILPIRGRSRHPHKERCQNKS